MGRRKPIASSLPFYLDYADDGTPHAAFHVARGNALIGLADGKSCWLLAVNGADAYISPDWYASPDQVPTWLYQAVHLTGTVRSLSDDELGRASRRAQRQIRKLARAETALDLVEDDGGAAGCDEKSHCGAGDDGRGGRRQFQAQPAQIRRRSCRRLPRRWRRKPIAPRRRSANRWSRCGRSWITNQRCLSASRRLKERTMTLTDTRQPRSPAAPTAKPTVFVDGAAGTTGLGIRRAP